MVNNVKKGVSATILSFIGSSFILGIIMFYFKDTMNRIDKTIEKVNQRDVKMVKLEDSVDTLVSRLTKLDDNIDKTGSILKEYTDGYNKNLMDITIAIEKTTQKLSFLDEKCRREDRELQKCKAKIDKLQSNYIRK